MESSHPDIERVLYTEEAIAQRVSELGELLTAEYSDKNPLFLGILKGSCVFMADLVRKCPFKLELQFVRASSYKSGTVSGKIDLDVNVDVAGRHVVIVEDILDSGKTLSMVAALLKEQEPASLKIVTFLNKKVPRAVSIEADYSGFDCEPYFVVGYGLDYAERYRNLPYIGILDPKVYSQNTL